MKNLYCLLLLFFVIVACRFSPTKIEVGSTHNCAIVGDGPGPAFCWGENEFGQLGNMLMADSPSPVPVSGGLTFLEVSAGKEHSCGVASDGRTYCWGRDLHGELGNGPPAGDPGNSNVPVPVSVPDGKTFATISAGNGHTCALTFDGEAFCWGLGGSGQLGNGLLPNVQDIPVPVSLPLGQKFSRISAGHQNTCALTASGEAYCWGTDTRGEIGDDADAVDYDVSIPTAVFAPGGALFKDISVGDSWHVCAVSLAGRVYCWGYNNLGQLGSETDDVENGIPTEVAGGLSHFVSVSAGGSHSCAVSNDNKVFCWGDNSVWQIGIGTAPDRVNAPTEVPFPVERKILSVGAGEEHTCARTSTAETYCWGANGSGQLGSGSNEPSSSPQLVP